MQEEEQGGSRDTQCAQAEVNESGKLHGVSNKRDRNSEEKREKYIAPQKKRKGLSPSDREEEAYSILKNACQRDDCSIYGEHVANELRNLSCRARTMVKHIINNTLFEAAMGKYDEPSHASTPLYNSESSSCGTVLSSGTENMPTHTSAPSSTPLHSNYSYTVLPPEPSASTFSQSQETSKHSDDLLAFPALSEFLISNSDKLT